jgi:hypothetical protein
MAKGLHKLTVQEAENAKLGQAGALVIPDGNTDEHTGPFVAITALSAAVIDTSECDVSWLTGPSGTLPGTIPIPVGTTIYGDFASIELDSGDVIAYYG